MHDLDIARTPRWSNVGRDRKALAIWRTMERNFGPGVSKGAWLDVGCGSGAIATTLAGIARHVTGIDPEPWDAWRGAMAEHSNLRLMVGEFDGPEPPLPGASIDVVVCNQVYEHVRDPFALIRNINRVLVPGGVCYFAGPNLLWPIEPHVFWPFVHWLPRSTAHRTMTVLGSRCASELDAYSTTSWRLVSWFRQSGFSVRNAIPQRALSIEGKGLQPRVMRTFGRLPGVVHDLLLPLMPSFVFLLKKQS
ncbi:class I SAM-dependent methyltransferase [Luteimonas sp. SJ-92]|uniref:Class I SAM-dependent methyltransferase n=1 Tax=Luteimonas salinisoli TaxID=2752307 RepID=A0A853JI10_9GAMM|nr:class I SAM-dependent methyltransferase [Luteimonas salinisoli]NZA28352.1 class I SAM-dependent methyltransferase [Luteimonas salinisoli]